MKYCPNCGNEVKPGQAFCNKCGNTLKRKQTSGNVITRETSDSIQANISRS